MQIRFFTIPVMGGEAITSEMNVFLRSKKILQSDTQLVANGQNSFWCVCIKYIDDISIQDKNHNKVDYKEVLDEESFKRFTLFRDVRKRVAQEDSVPAYAVFTDEELAGLAKITQLTLANMKSVKGIGEKKVEKYGKYFIHLSTNGTATENKLF